MMVQAPQWNNDDLQAASDQVAHAIDYALREMPHQVQIAALTVATVKVLATYGSRPGAVPLIVTQMAEAMVAFASENSAPLEELRARFQAPLQ